MWVIKIGGSLSGDPLLPRWLELITQLGGGRSVIVAGGGGFADRVRDTQARWRFDGVAAHNMAVLAMAQTAYLLHGLHPALQPARSEGEIRAALRRGRTALWLPFELLRDAADAITSWEVSADSLALGLAQRLDAERLVLVKSCPVDATLSHAELAEAGVLDRRFAALARDAAPPIEIFERSELDRARAMLIGDVRVGAA